MTLTQATLILRTDTNDMAAFGYTPTVRTKAKTDIGILAAVMDSFDTPPLEEGVVIGVRFKQGNRLRVLPLTPQE